MAVAGAPVTASRPRGGSPDAGSSHDREHGRPSDPARRRPPIRIGLASGAVLGGVIGQRRLLFDLWGDAVNLASRMESSGIPGRIQISAATRSLLDDLVDLEPREVDVKGFGRQTTYLVS